MIIRLLIFELLIFLADCQTRFSVPESAPVGHHIGYINGHSEEPKNSENPRYFVVFPDEQSAKFLKVDERSGHITTAAQLDYEQRAKFEIVAVSVEEAGKTVDVVVEVVDENDNAPKFGEDRVKLEISEFAQQGTSFPLPTVTDGDGPKFDVHRFVILQGNVNNVFKISTRRVNEQLQADLVVNGQLDREFRDKYELLIEAQDGGKPAKTGQLRCSIEIIDANDNAPIFTRSRYTASISANISIGSNIITVIASDADIGENSRISYEIRKSASPGTSSFGIGATSGTITTVSHLLPGSTHDVIVVASDHGTPQLSSQAVVTITVLGSSLSPPPLDIIWLDSNSAHLMENATLGSIVARVSVSSNYRDAQLKLLGTTVLCPQQTDQSHVYLLLLCGILDRETISEYQLKFVLAKNGKTIVEHPQLLTIGDVNDNAPQWKSAQVHISLNRTANSGPERILSARDPDLAHNGWIRYSILDTDLVAIDKETGRVYVPKTIDCSAGSEIKFRVRAEDGGTPALSTDLQVTADLLDASSRPPQFEKAMWSVEILEDTPVGTCLVKVLANNSQCGSGGTKRVRYSLNKDEQQFQHLSIDSMSGTVCIQKAFDFEKEPSFQTTVTATNSNGETSTSLISIRLKDVNDNWPIFYPNEYHLTIREHSATLPGPLLVVSASDADSGRLGEVSYQILSESHSFSINAVTGEVFAKKPLPLGRFHLVISAKDGGGQTAENPANVHINVIDKSTKTPEFSRSKYEIRTSEDILPGIAIGSVAAISEGRIRYSIYSGDPENSFSIDEKTGKIYVTRYLDADVHDEVLLNVQAAFIDGDDMGQTNQTQVLIHIEDHNDNPPKFPSSTIEISVKEDIGIGEPFYAVHASDRDKKKNGEVKYSIISSHPGSSIEVDPRSGQLSTSSAFDYEQVRDYKVRIKATDAGIPPRSSNLTLFVHILDVNDNSPIFQKSAYFMQVLENSPPKTIIGKVAASDKDSLENGQLAYRVTNGSEYFGVDEKLGTVYTKRSIDREVISFLDVTVVAEDGGVPPKSASVNLRVQILDVNDNAPSCASITPIVVPATHSSVPLSTPIGTIVASDPDKGLNGSIVYRAQLQSHSQLFVVKSNGDVYLRRQLNSSEEHFQRLSVIVSDQGAPRKSSVCHVAVRVAQGASSIVLREPVKTTVTLDPEICSSGCRLLELNASGVESWRIQSSDISNHFTIRDGVLAMVSRPTHRPPYTIGVIMVDRDGRQKSLAIRVIGDQDRNGLDVLKIDKSTGIGTKVGSLGSGGSGEKIDGIYYQDFRSSASDCPLELDQSTGFLYLARKLSSESSNLTCNFQRINTSSTTNDVQDLQVSLELDTTHSRPSKPEFESSYVKVLLQADAKPGTTVATMNASSGEEDISYRLTTPSDLFQIDQFTGEVSLVDGPLPTGTYLLTVEAYGSSGPSSVALLEVKVSEDPQAPEITSETQILLPGNWRKNDKVHWVVSKDRATYSIVPSSDLFAINDTTGVITMLSSSGSSSSSDLPNNLTVRATNLLDPSKFVEQVLQVISSNTTKDRSSAHFFEVQYQAITTGSDPSNPIVTFPTGSTGAKLTLIPESAYFKLDGHQVSQIGTVPAGNYRFTVVAELENDVDYTVLEITVPSTVPEPMKIASTSCGSVTVPENVELIEFKRIMAVGTTSNSRYRLQGSSTSSSTPTFTINEKTGAISSRPLDRELAQEHLLIVILTDVSGSNPRNDSCTVRVLVQDQNDNQPEFGKETPSSLTIPEGANVGDVLYQFGAKDMDIGRNGKISYELIDDESRSLDLVPETGALVLRRSSGSKDWKIKVRAVDYGGKSSEVILEVLNQNSEDPNPELQFLRQSYIASIDESLPRGQFVGKLELSEETSPVTFSIIEGNTDSAFSIDQDGIVRTNLELDNEIVDRYNLKIIGISSKNQITTRMDVRVNNLNDNPPNLPVIKPKKVSEATKPGSYVASMEAKDVDQLGPLQYFLEDPNGGNSKFHIDRFTGIVHLAAPLDFELQKSYNLRVKVTDGTFDTFGNLTIMVTDVNDNSPKFDKPIYHWKTSEVGKIGNIEASDPDFGPITFSLAESSGNSLFTIDPTTGTISLATLPPLDNRYLLTVTAQDAGIPSKSTSVPLIVTIGTVTPTVPSATCKEVYKFDLLESSPVGTVVGNLTGFSDPLEISTGLEYFEVDKFGRIIQIRQIDRESMENFEFFVDKCRVQIAILDVNDNSPVFANSIVNVGVKDSMAHGQVLVTLLATDLDLAENGRVTYRILTGNDYNIVTLNPETGILQFNEWNDAQLEQFPNGTWKLLVEARDHGLPYRSTIATVILTLKTSSGSAPFFVLPAYEVHVLEDAKLDTVIQKVRASCRLGTEPTGLLYSLKAQGPRVAIDVKTGEIRLKSHLDWETERMLEMQLSVSDGNGRSAVVPLRIVVEPVDEFAPVFTGQDYRVQIPITSSPDEILGQVQAIDEDGGIHGVVKYKILEDQNSQKIVKIDPDSGVIRLLTAQTNISTSQITVLAYSSPGKTSRTTVTLEVGNFSAPKPNIFHSRPILIGVLALVLLMVLLIVLICICMCKKPKKSKNFPEKTQKTQVYSVKTGELSTTSSDNFQKIGVCRSQMDSGIDGDTVSVNSSITDYLVSLGVNANPIPPRIRPTTTYDSLMNEYIYARVEDVLPAGPISLTSAQQHSLLRQPLSSVSTRRPPIIPSFEPLTEIFSEILEDSKRKEYVQVEI